MAVPTGDPGWEPRGSHVIPRPPGGGGADSERWDLSLALVAGGEYFLVPALGLGGEIGLEYTRVGDDGTGDDQTASLISTLAELRLRWYP